MTKRSRFEEYKDKYKNYRFEKTPDKILLFQMHTDGGEILWDWEAHDAFGDAIDDIAGDRDINVVIFTGSGDSFLNVFGEPDSPAARLASIDLGAEGMDEKGWYGRQRHWGMLGIQVPVIGVLNGPCSAHSELLLMCDILIASEDAYFRDAAHFPRGLVPGDGTHTIWPMVLGPSRARYYMLTGKKITAQEAHEWGVVSEVLPKDQLMDRAWELAHFLNLRPPLTLRLTRSVFTQPFKRAAVNDFDLGQYQEMYAMRNFFSLRGGIEPLDRAWNDDPWAPAGLGEGKSS